MIGNLADSDNSEKTAAFRQALHPITIERVFTNCVMDCRQIMVLDGIDIMTDGFRIRRHDLYGPLPEIDIRDTEDRLPVLDNIQMETARLCAVVQIRDNLAGMFPGCKFLPPTKTDSGVLIGLRFAGRTVLAEGQSYCETYHKLTRKAVRRIL